MEKKFFYVDDIPSVKGYWIIRPNHSEFKLSTNFSGSYALLEARLFGLSFANYLRYCRDTCGAYVRGKGSRYPIEYYPRKEDAQKVADILNARANLVFKVQREI